MRDLRGLMPPVADCLCGYCSVLRGRLRDGAEFELRDTVPTPVTQPEATRIAPDFMAELGEAMRNWNGVV